MRFNYFKTTNLLLAVFMIAAAGLTVAITPTRRLADQGPRINLGSMIPKKFADWSLDETELYRQVSPEVKAELDKIYTQILTRTYVNSQGYRVMLSVPYGADQSDSLSAHDPEGCYPAQGFQIMSKGKDVLHTEYGDLPLRRMEALGGMRHELVTYWFTVGQYAVNNDWDRKKAKLGYAIKGEIPDGLLFRASSIDTNTQQAYHIHEIFIEDMLKTLTSQSRFRLAGLPH